MAALRPLCLTSLRGMVFAALLLVFSAQAQEQFFTQSGGHGIENAKANARLTKAEKDIDSLNVEVAKVKPHAKVEIPSCADAGSKLRWNNNSWTCDNETDPTVQPWAKKALPGCGAGQILSVSGGEFGCVNSNYLTNETDPTVQAWAKSALPSCGNGESLTSTGGAFTCKVDEKGITQETDPYVYDFARTDKAVITDCNGGQKLTMNGGRLICSADIVGLTSETDPLVQAFARKDVSGSILGACPSGNVVTAVNNGGVVQLKCTPDVGGSASAIALSNLSDVNTSGAASGTALIYSTSSGKWEAATPIDTTVKNWARQNITTCTAGQVVIFDGNSLQCVNASSVISTTFALSQLSDVSISNVANHHILHYDGTKWVNDNKIDGVAIGSQVSSTGVFTQMTASGIGAGNIAASGAVTAAAMATSASLVEGNARVTGDLRVGGNFYVSGAQSIDGVVFANGGVSATGTISATKFYGDGSGLTGVVASSADWYSLNRIPAVIQNISNSVGSVSVTSVYVSNATVDNDLRVKGNLYVSGSQSFDGVTFANGGVSATGIVTATGFAGDGSALTGVTAASMNWYGLVNVPTQVASVSDSGSIGMAQVSATRLYASSVSGSTGTFGSIGVGNIAASGQITATAVGANLISATAPTGVVTATYVYAHYISGTQINGTFVGDGSGLTGVTAAASDRIVSGTTNVIANSSGNIDFKSGSTLTGYYTPAGVMTSVGVSTTSTVSATGLYVNGDAAISGTAKLAGTGSETCDATAYGTMRYVSLGGGAYGLQLCRP